MGISLRTGTTSAEGGGGLLARTEEKEGLDGVG